MPNQCPLWVTGGHGQRKTACPLFPDSDFGAARLKGDVVLMLIDPLRVISTP